MLDKSNSQYVTAYIFIAIVHKYTCAKTFTPKMVNELIQYTEGHQTEKIDGVWEQRIIIHYNCVDVIDIPGILPNPKTKVTINTRKGVVVNYAPNTMAV